MAAIMCGGRATRMKSGTEKPLLKVDGVAMVERVVSALADSRKFDRIVAAVSPSTPKTKEFLEARGIKVVETVGEGYSQDLSSLLARLRPAKVLVVPADVPLLSVQVISDISGIASTGPAISVAMEKKFVQSIGIKPSVLLTLDGRNYCHSGITIFDTAKITSGIVKERYVIMNRIEVAVNVNTKEELELAEKLLVQRA